MDPFLEQFRRLADAMYPGIIEAIDIQFEYAKEKKAEREKNLVELNTEYKSKQ